jgi:hypothetical protein
MKIIIIALTISIISGCTDHYRYACHDIDRWQEPECQKPRCMVNQECPEDVLGSEIMEELQRQAKSKGAR